MYQIPGFTPPAGFKYAISDTSDGNLSYKYGDFELAKAARQNFLQNATIPQENTNVMFIEMKDKIIEMQSGNNGESVLDPDKVIICDAMITNKKNVALFLLVADCVPIVLFDKDLKSLAIVHHGLKNTELSLVSKVINELETRYGTKPQSLTALIGPAIQKQSYVYDYFDNAALPHWQDFVVQREDGKFHIDNVGKTIQLIKDAGVLEENIHNSGVDTFTSNDFYSHKRDFDNGRTDQGRHAMVAMLI